MTYLLDTTACIAVINGRPESVRDRLRKAEAGGGRLLTSSIVLFELWYGVAKSSRRDLNEARLVTFLSGPVLVEEFVEDDARAAGSIRADLERAGTPIGAYDLLIAAQARRRGATLVTANAAEFGRVAGLGWEDWSTAGS